MVTLAIFDTYKIKYVYSDGSFQILILSHDDFLITKHAADIEGAAPRHIGPISNLYFGINQFAATQLSLYVEYAIAVICVLQLQIGMLKQLLLK
jgi:hypothetical protein